MLILIFLYLPAGLGDKGNLESTYSLNKNEPGIKSDL